MRKRCSVFFLIVGLLPCQHIFATDVFSRPTSSNIEIRDEYAAESKRMKSELEGVFASRTNDAWSAIATAGCLRLRTTSRLLLTNLGYAHSRHSMTTNAPFSYCGPMVGSRMLFGPYPSPNALLRIGGIDFSSLSGCINAYPSSFDRAQAFRERHEGAVRRLNGAFTQYCQCGQQTQ